MRAFSTTYIFAAVVAAVVGFSVYEFKRGEKEEQKKAAEALVFDFKTEDVNEVSVKRPDGNLQLQRNEADWKILQPYQDSADGGQVAMFLDSVLGEKAKKVDIAEGSAIKWTDYGLEPAGSEWEFKLKSGDVVKVSVSLNSAFDGGFFIRRGDQLLLGERTWAQHTGQDAARLRDKRLITLAGDYRELKFSHRWLGVAKDFQFAKVGEKWQMTSNKGLPIDDAKLNTFIGELLEVHAEQFVTDAQAKNLKDLGLDKPIFSATLKVKNDQKEEALILDIGQGKGEGQYYARTNRRATIAKVPKGYAERTEAILDDFRDGAFPFALDVEKVNKVVATIGGISYSVKKNGSEWTLDSQAQDQELDNDRLQALFAMVKGLRARAFIDPMKMKGSVKLRDSLQFFDSAGASLLNLTWGGFLPSVRGRAKAEQLTYVRSNLTPEILGVPAEITTFPYSAIARAKGGAKPNPESSK